MSWEDEDFSVPVAATNEFDEEDDDGLVDDWEAFESDDDKPKAAPKPKVSSGERIAARRQKEQEERERKAMEKNQEATLKELRDKELEADLDSAADLLAAADVHPRSRKKDQDDKAAAGPVKLSDLAIFKATNAKQYTDLRKTVVPVINQLAEKNSGLHHSNFIIETCRDLCGPLTSDQVNKVISTLQAIANAKYREERARRLGSRSQKPQIKQASAKQQAAAPKTQNAVEELEDDGLEDDDFM